MFQRYNEEKRREEKDAMDDDWSGKLNFSSPLGRHWRSRGEGGRERKREGCARTHALGVPSLGVSLSAGGTEEPLEFFRVTGWT